MNQSKVKLDPLFKLIKLDFITYKKNIENPLSFYDQNYVEKCNRKLLDNIERASE
jgi:hypothetical protein